MGHSWSHAARYFALLRPVWTDLHLTAVHSGTDAEAGAGGTMGPGGTVMLALPVVLLLSAASRAATLGGLGGECNLQSVEKNPKQAHLSLKAAYFVFALHFPEKNAFLDMNEMVSIPHCCCDSVNFKTINGALFHMTSQII